MADKIKVKLVSTRFTFIDDNGIFWSVNCPPMSHGGNIFDILDANGTKICRVNMPYGHINKTQAKKHLLDELKKYVKDGHSKR